MSNLHWAARKISELRPSSFLDIGPGAGKYGKLVREHSPSTIRHAVEIWAPYIKQFNLEQLYHKVYVCDARIFFSYKYDLVVFGDILEHMTREEAVALWQVVSSNAKSAIISMPIIHYPQSGEENPFQEHVKDDWTHEEIMSTFSKIVEFETYEETGSYFAVFSA